MLLKNTDHMRIYILVGLTLFLWTNYTVQGQSAFSRCHVLFPRDSCYAVFKPLRENLLRNSRNIYELNRAFYPMGRFTSTVLINILYSVDFMQTAFSFNNTPVCSGVDQNSSLLERDIDNDRVLFLSGWSSSEIFNVISPLQLSQIQLQISNDIFSLFVIPGSGIALPQRFGWVIQDAQHSLVNLDFTNLVYINITVTDNISCVPNEQLIHSALQEITIMVYYYYYGIIIIIIVNHYNNYNNMLSRLAIYRLDVLNYYDRLHIVCALYIGLQKHLHHKITTVII